MTTPVQLQGIGGERRHKRATHKKSRRGCGNCKLRRVKCDETQPTCKKCTTFRVACNYHPETPDLQMSVDGTATIKSLRKPPTTYQALPGRIEIPPSLYPAIIPESTSTFLYNRQSLERLSRFFTRTIFSIGSTKGASTFQMALIKLVGSHPYLMHVVQTVTSIHDRYLSTHPRSRHTVAEVYHMSQAAALFNKKLLEPIQPPDRDGLWATAALLSIVAFCSVEASKPEEAWPLKYSEASDLDWITMSKSKAVIWNVANPSRPDSLFRAAYENFPLGIAATGSEIECLPSAFIQLYEIDGSSTTATNPYHATLNILAPLLSIECEGSNFINFVLFISHMEPDFKKLLEQKDARALLLLAYWYAKVRHAVWWIERRATFEGQAICLYLERYHAGETAIQELLLFPKMKCGLVT